MKIINWLATPEGKMTSEYGPEGLCWYYDENGKTCLTDSGLSCRNNKDTEMTGDGYSGTWQDGTNQMNNITWSADATNPDSNGETYNYLNWASYNATQNYDILNDWRNFTGFTTQDEYLEARPFTIAVGTKFTMATRSDELDVKWQQVTTAIKDYSWQAIYANNEDEFNDIVAEMQQKVKDYGWDECAKFCQEQAALRKAAEDEVKAE
jgi:multiple sugar transport system substrate-binding protein/putative aldouronate transport system substrate-binding protein